MTKDEILKKCDEYIISSIIPLIFAKNIDKNIDELIEKEINNSVVSGGIYLFGNSGTGKTTICWGMIRKIILNAIDKKLKNESIYHYLEKIDRNQIKVSDIVSEEESIYSLVNLCYLSLKIKTYFDNKDFEIMNKIDALAGVKYLFLDDLGTEKISGFVFECLYRILNNRYENKLFTVFTSNYSISHISSVVSDKIASRISAMCYPIKINGIDKRIKKTK